MKKYLFLFTLLITGLAYGQIRFNNTVNNISATNSSSFLDASSNTTVNASTNLGKGLLYPRTNLTTFTAFSGSPVGIGNSYPTRFDGLVVYNTAASGVAGVGATQGTLTEGFWYYDNKSGTVNGGTWRPIGGPAATVKEAVLTYVVPANNNTADLGLSTAAATLVSGVLPSASNAFLSATVYGANNAVVVSSAAYNTTTSVLTTGSGFINQVLAPGTYTIVVAYR